MSDAYNVQIDGITYRVVPMLPREAPEPDQVFCAIQSLSTKGHGTEIGHIHWDRGIADEALHPRPHDPADMPVFKELMKEIRFHANPGMVFGCTTCGAAVISKEVVPAGHITLPVRCINGHEHSYEAPFP
jgi:hypothetical protein